MGASFGFWTGGAGSGYAAGRDADEGTRVKEQSLEQVQVVAAAPLDAKTVLQLAVGDLGLQRVRSMAVCRL